MEPKERPENRTVDLLGTFFCVVLLLHAALSRALSLHVAFLYTVLLYAALSRIISFWLQLTRERPYRQAACHHSGATSFVTRKGIHVES